MPETPLPPRHDPYAALRYPEFRALAFGAFLLSCGILIQEVALSYEIYRVTHDPLSLGLIGLAEAVPFITLALFGGHLADRREKRGLIRNAIVVVLFGSAAIALLRSEEHTSELQSLMRISYAVFCLKQKNHA